MCVPYRRRTLRRGFLLRFPFVSWEAALPPGSPRDYGCWYNCGDGAARAFLDVHHAPSRTRKSPERHVHFSGGHGEQGGGHAVARLVPVPVPLGFPLLPAAWDGPDAQQATTSVSTATVVRSGRPTVRTLPVAGPDWFPVGTYFFVIYSLSVHGPSDDNIFRSVFFWFFRFRFPPRQRQLYKRKTNADFSQFFFFSVFRIAYTLVIYRQRNTRLKSFRLAAEQRTKNIKTIRNARRNIIRIFYPGRPLVFLQSFPTHATVFSSTEACFDCKLNYHNGRRSGQSLRETFRNNLFVKRCTGSRIITTAAYNCLLAVEFINAKTRKTKNVPVRKSGSFIFRSLFSISDKEDVMSAASVRPPGDIEKTRLRRLPARFRFLSRIGFSGQVNPTTKVTS